MRATIDDELVIHAPTFGGASKVSEIRANPSVRLTCGRTTSEYRAPASASTDERPSALTRQIVVSPGTIGSIGGSTVWTT